MRSLFGLPAVGSSSGSVLSAVLPSVSGATGLGRGLSVVPGWDSPSVATSVSAPVALGALLGWSSVASGVAPSLVSSVPSGVASAVPSAAVSSVSSGSDGFAHPLPVYSVVSVASSVSAPLPFSMASLLAPPPCTLPSAPLSSSAAFSSSQPLGPVGPVSLGSGGGVSGETWFQE